MEHLSGAIATDEDRQVGHYWLRNPNLAPTSIRADIIEALIPSKRSPRGTHRCVKAVAKLESFLIIGIGGSALGPQFVSDALETN